MRRQTEIDKRMLFKEKIFSRSVSRLGRCVQKPFPPFLRSKHFVLGKGKMCDETVLLTMV